jgi:hypothetical protein
MPSGCARILTSSISITTSRAGLAAGRSLSTRLTRGQPSEMAQSLLDALEGSLRIFEKHRMFLLSCSVNRPTKGESSKRPDPARNSHDGSGLATTPAARGAMTYEPPPHLPPGFGTRRDTKSERKPRTCRGLQLPNKGETLEDLKSL